jgi:hypothetical protein
VTIYQNQGLKARIAGADVIKSRRNQKKVELAKIPNDASILIISYNQYGRAFEV